MVLHINNEQPLLADLYELPANADVAVLCTNLRELNGKRPIFADRIESDFLFPLLHLRFIEMPVGTIDEGGEHRPAAPATRHDDGDGADGTGPIDEQRRLPAGTADEASASAQAPPLESELDMDEDLLRRIRDA